MTDADAGEPLLEAEGLNAWYGDSHILHGVSLRLQSRQAVALMGRNGAGKSTTLKSIMNAGTRVRGMVRWKGRELGRMPTYRRARMGLVMVPEDRRIYPHVTVRENLELARHSLREGESAYSIEEIVGFFPMLKEVLERSGAALSGGQQQMVAVARALLARPECVLLDEPAEGLAPVIVEQLAEQVNRMRRQEGLTLLLTEQNLWFSRACTDYVYLIDSGQVVFEGSWEDFDRHPEIQSRYLAL